MPSQEQYDRYRQTIREKIAEHGWMVQGVFPTTMQEGPAFGYTIGLTDAGLPELLLVGNLGFPNLQALLNGAALMHVKNEIQPGDELTDLANMPFRVIAASTSELGMAHNYYRGLKEVRALQLIWPDPDGKFPGESQFFTDAKQKLFPL
jgi:hypothetical protein